MENLKLAKDDRNIIIDPPLPSLSRVFIAKSIPFYPIFHGVWHIPHLVHHYFLYSCNLFLAQQRYKTPTEKYNNYFTTVCHKTVNEFKKKVPGSHACREEVLDKLKKKRSRIKEA